MRRRSLCLGLLFIFLGIAAGCRQKRAAASSDPLTRAYGAEQDWNDPQRMIPLDYQQEQGRRIFYDRCVWCHADATPAGPSNRSNVTPNPALANDGTVLEIDRLSSHRSTRVRVQSIPPGELLNSSIEVILQCNVEPPKPDTAREAANEAG